MMGRKRRDKDEPTRVDNYEDMTTMNITVENRNKIAMIADYLERKYYKETQKRRGYILNDGVTHLLEKIEIEDYLQEGIIIIYITKEFHFHAAHTLENHPGKCKNLHGHTYKLEVTLRGEIKKGTGMLIDFGNLKKIVKKDIIHKVDHGYLNDIFDFIPTAENMIKHFYEVLKDILGEHLYSIRLWETDTSSAIYKGVE